MTYNILAFLTQPLTGMWVDRIKHKHWILLTSILSLTMAVLVASFVMAAGASLSGMAVVAVLLGVGNSLFHVWGGKLVAVQTENDIRALGVFVATGAFGLSIGMLFFSWPLLYAFLLSICLLSMLCLNLDTDFHHTTTHTTVEKRKFSTLFVSLAIIALMAAVLLRSFVGEAFTGGISKDKAMILLIGMVCMLGKMAGGWIAKWMGIVRSLVLILALLLCSFLFKDRSIILLMTGLFAVNCTMPITLYLANVVLPKREGLAFGLLAAALIPGYLIALCL